MTRAIRDTDDGLVIQVQVVPRAKHDAIGPIVGERLKVRLTAPPVDGAANLALVALLAKSLGVPQRHIELLAGQHSRQKTLHITGADRARLEALIEDPT